VGRRARRADPGTSPAVFVVVPWYQPIPTTPAAFRALKSDDEAAREWTDERRLDLILSIVIGELGLREAAALFSVPIRVIETWKEELLYDGRGPADKNDDDDDDDLDMAVVLVT
jgi:hypothetical protein